MIEEIGRHVAQKVSFNTHTRYARSGAIRHAVATFQDEGATPGGLFQTAARMHLKPGEMMAVWSIPADEHRSFAELETQLAPIPSKLLVRSADGKLLELNPSYISINNRPDEYREFTLDEKRAYGLPV